MRWAPASPWRSHDLDIRGAGNLLGDEQSGHIREVGIELYQQMLEDAVAELRAGEGRRGGQERDWTPNISLGLPVLIPEAYVRDLPVRLGLYRRIGALASDAETEAMAAELVDRFGPLPQEVENLLQVVALKRACREAGVEKLEAGPKGHGAERSAAMRFPIRPDWWRGSPARAVWCVCAPTTSWRSRARWMWRHACASRATRWAISNGSPARPRRLSRFRPPRLPPRRADARSPRAPARRRLRGGRR